MSSEFYKFVLIICIAFGIVACGKKEPMYNNPNAIIIYKDGESLTDLAKRIMGAKVDSFGIALDKDQSAYESKPFLITGIFNQPGQPIFDV
jgi:predicted small lipoprotein YifL